MKLHANATLTVKQRREVKRLHEEEKVSIRQLAARYRVSTTTIGRWLKRERPYDRSGTPRPGQRVVTPEYRAAVLKYRQAYPHHGPIRIAGALQAQFPIAHRGTVQQILQTAKLSQRQTAKPEPRKIPVGRHRVQMDIQQLPAIEGESGHEYKISLIHLNTRVKYSEIHRECTSQTVAEVFERALDQLPPF